VDVDTELATGWAERLRQLARDTAWSQPEDVRVDEGPGMIEGVCVGAVSYDLVRVEHDRAVHLRRACGGPERGSVADVLAAVVGSALGHDLRFDVLFPHGADYSATRRPMRICSSRAAASLPSKARLDRLASAAGDGQDDPLRRRPGLRRMR